MHSGFMEFEFGKIHYQHSTSDKEKKPSVLHSFNSSAASFTNVCDLLEGHFNLFCLDFPGHGLSEHVDMHKYSQYYSVEGLTTILIEFVNRLKINNLFILGNSMGGNAAVRAVPALKTIKGLILEGSIQEKTKEKLFNVMFPTAPLDLLFKKILNEDEVEIITGAYVYKSIETQKRFDQMAHDIKNTDGDFRAYFSRYLETQAWVDEIQIIKNSALPFLYILGMEDGFINSVYYKKLLIEEGFQESQIKLLDRAGHSPHLDNPHLCAKLILDFINSIE